MYVQANDILSAYIQNITYQELARNERTDKTQPEHCVSERFDFLKVIEMANRKHGQIDNLVIAADMWPYGINLCWGDPEGIVQIDSFYEYPHKWDIQDIKLIGLNAGRKLKSDRETFVESLLNAIHSNGEYFIKGKIIYYAEPFFRILFENEDAKLKRILAGKFRTIYREKP
jgi:hypothetical protein